jgi:hypothetical protein
VLNDFETASLPLSIVYPHARLLPPQTPFLLDKELKAAL